MSYTFNLHNYVIYMQLTKRMPMNETGNEKEIYKTIYKITFSNINKKQNQCLQLLTFICLHLTIKGQPQYKRSQNCNVSDIMVKTGTDT